MTSFCPDFFVIGSAKSGTTSLCSALERHQQIVMSNPKEPNFFAFDEIFENGLSWYNNCFSSFSHNKKIGEGSVAYSSPFFEKKVIERIKEASSDENPKFIFIARHPIKRIESAWSELCTNGFHFGDDNLRWKNVPRSLQKALLDSRSTLVEESMYYERVSLYIEHFSKNNVHLLFLEDFSENIELELKKCLTFLGVDSNISYIGDLDIQNGGETKRRDTDFTHFLRNNARFLLKFGNKIPVLGPWARQKMRVAISKDNVWDAETYNRVIARLLPDSKKFLELADKPSNFWEF